MNYGFNDQHPDRQLQPVIAELLRTCVHSPTLLLRVERIVRERLGASPDNAQQTGADDDANSTQHTTKLLLTDGQLVVQALLHRRLSSQPDCQDIRTGDLIELWDFQVKRAKQSNGNGQVVYLGIEECQIISQTASLATEAQNISRKIIDSCRGTKRELNPEAGDSDEYKEDGTAGGFLKKDHPNSHSIKKLKTEGDTSKYDKSITRNTHMTARSSRDITGQDLIQDMTTTEIPEAEQQIRSFHHAHPPDTPAASKSETRRFINSTFNSNKLYQLESESEDEDENAFETVKINNDVATKRRHALHESEQNLAPRENDSPNKPIPAASVRRVESGMKHTIKKSVTFDIKSTSRPPPQLIHQTSTNTDEPPSPSKPQNSLISSAQSQTQHPLPEPPLHTLLSILHPPHTFPLPRKSYRLTTLAIITYVGSSLITRPNSPFPPKRHLKIEDPTLHLPKHPSSSSSSLSTIQSSNDKRGKGITLAIYRDASTFKPAPGTLALFRGVVMQRLNNGDIILNVYPVRNTSRALLKLENTDGRDGDGDGDGENDANHGFREDEWFITDQPRLKKMGYNIDPLLRWWEGRKKELDSR